MTLEMRFLLVSLLVTITGRLGFLGPLRDAAVGLSAPFEQGALSFSRTLRRETGFWFRLDDFRERHFQLEKKLSELEGRLSLLKEVERENSELREQLGSRLAQSGNEFLTAQVVGIGGWGTSSALAINRGDRQGIAEGSVVVSGNFLVGEVETTGPERSLVRLLTDPAFEVAVLDQDSPQRARGIAQGEFGTYLLMRGILPSEDIAVGDMILTSGVEGSFPPGLVVGRVSKVIGEESDALRSAEVETLFDPFRLEKVFILKKSPSF